MIETIYKLILCHVLGDYVLQCDYIAKTKGDNIYHLIVHCLLYTAPFGFIIGFDWRLCFIFASHLIIDYLKANKKAISYTVDQVLHYLCMAIYLIS